jgi:hypothetical protein
MLKLITDIHPAPAGFLDAVSRKKRELPYVALRAEWRALSRCCGRVANDGYILLNEMYRLVRAWLSFGHYPHFDRPICRLCQQAVHEFTAFSARDCT